MLFIIYTAGTGGIAFHKRSIILLQQKVILRCTNKRPRKEKKRVVKLSWTDHLVAGWVFFCAATGPCDIMFCYHCPPSLHPSVATRLQSLELPFGPASLTCKWHLNWSLGTTTHMGSLNKYFCDPKAVKCKKKLSVHLSHSDPLPVALPRNVTNYFSAMWPVVVGHCAIFQWITYLKSNFFWWKMLKPWSLHSMTYTTAHYESTL